MDETSLGVGLFIDNGDIIEPIEYTLLAFVGLGGDKIFSLLGLTLIPVILSFDTPALLIFL